MEAEIKRPVVADGPGNELNDFTLDFTDLLSESPARGFKSYSEWTADQKEDGNCFVVNRVYVDITGDLKAGALLSQICYWFSPNSAGESRIRITKGGRGWVAKRIEDWYDEIRITAKEYRRAIKRLKDLRLVEVGNWRFNGLRTQHVSLNEERLVELVNDYFAKREGELSGGRVNYVRSKKHPRSGPKGTSGQAQRARPITSITTGITKKIKEKAYMGELRKKRNSPVRSVTCKNELNFDSKDEPQPPREKHWVYYKREAGGFYETNVRHGKAVDKNHHLYPSWKGFERFWELYPDRRKRDKKKSWVAWHDATRIESAEDFEKERPFLTEILRDVAQKKEHEIDWLNGYAPRPVTYLSQRRWEVSIVGKNKKEGSKQWDI